MMGQRIVFKELDENICGQVMFGDGSFVQIKGKGSMFFSAKTTSRDYYVTYTSYRVSKVILLVLDR